MPRQPTRQRRQSRITEAMMLEDLNVMSAGNADELAAHYGSLSIARERFDHLHSTGQLPRSHGQLPAEIFWLTEPDVPDELRSEPTEPDPDVLADVEAVIGDSHHSRAIAIADSLEVARWRWLAETARLSDEERHALVENPTISPGVRRPHRIAAAVTTS